MSATATLPTLPEIAGRSLYTDLKKPHRWELLAPVTVQLSSGEWITIPAGTITDFATVPRLCWGIVATTGRHNLATLIHDYLYDQQYGVKQGLRMDQARLQADKEMLYFLLLSGVSRFKAWIMYAAVRLGGRRWFEDQE